MPTSIGEPAAADCLSQPHHIAVADGAVLCRRSRPPVAGRRSVSGSTGGGTGLYCGDQDAFCFLIGPAGWAEIDGQ